MSGTIRDLVQRLESLGSSQTFDRLKRQLADDLHREMLQGFRVQRDPYGNAWAPRKSGGDWPLLDKSGKMVDRITARPTARGVRISTVDYAGYHQTGTRSMPSRKIVPDGERGLGLWEDTARDAVEHVIGLALEGK